MLNELKILGDNPFDDINEKDYLGYDDFVDSFLDIILNSKEATPFTIGIHGDWGVGKTTIMKRIQKKLKEKECLTIWFNPWKYGEKEEVWKGLIKTIFDEFETETVKDILSEVLSEKKEIFSKIIEDIINKFGFAETLSELRNISKLDTQFINEFENIMETLISRNLRRKNKDLLVIFVDDLDRCRPENAIKILEAIKLHLSVPKCTFMIGFDRDVVDRGIEIIYGRDSNINGTDYIKKIIQLPFKVPKPGKEEIVNYTEKCINKVGAEGIFSENGKIKEEYIDTIVQGTNSNPREIKRFLNSFVLLHNVKEEKMGIDYDPKKMIYLLLIQLRWNELFRLIDKNGNLMILLHEYIKGDEKTKERLKNELNTLIEKEDFLEFSKDNIPDFMNIREFDRYLEHSMLAKIEKEKPAAEEDLIDLLLTNVEEFNKLRFEKELTFIDLSSVCLKETNLSGVDFSFVYLRGADLSGSDIRKANLRKANLSMANIQGAKLVMADLSGADLSGADLRKADLWKANLRETNFVETNLGKANLAGANLEKANLWRADLSGADLNSAYLKGANLSDVNLSKAYLTDADLTEAALGNAKGWENVKDFKNTVLISVKELSRNDLKYAKKRGARV
ncbi:MAG: pentapeptide repeat-containing protein [Theionarchaea archaeon]|nr:pentapeptide repeat-containing protein [Theionarchaea archaeon]